jgi:ABC-type bacteriocin/lantibiotic exporter with double-glycine peptidase domain
MASLSDKQDLKRPIGRLLQLFRLERKEIGSIYLFAILAGLLQLSLPLGIQAIINFVLAGRVSTSMVVLIVLVVLAVFFTGLLQIGQMKVIERVQQRLFTRYAFEFAWRLPKLDLQKADNYYLPELVNRFFDIISLQKSISKLLLDIPTATIQVLFGLLLLSLYSNVFIFFSIFILLVVFLIIRYTGTMGLKTSLEESEYKYAIAGWLEEVARVLKSFRFSRGTQLPVQKTDVLVGNYLDARTRHFKILLFQYWALIGFKIVITAGMLVVGGVLLVRNQINVGQFVAAEIVVITVLSAVEKLIQSLEKGYDVLTSVEKLGKVIDNEIEEHGMLELKDEPSGLSLAFQKLGFGYSVDSMVLSDLNFEIKSGEKVCIMGKDGSGKTTLLKLLTGAYSSFSGNLLINDLPIGNYSLESLRSRIGILFRQQDIFQGTLYENIALGDQTVAADHIIKMAEILGLHDFIASQKKGLDTLLDPTGKRLPQGIIQKILLLRAFVSGSRLLLLEEPWFGFDDVCSARIQSYLLNALPGTTVLVISNDAAFAKQCDRVIVLENGSVKTIGKPSENL